MRRIAQHRIDRTSIASLRRLTNRAVTSVPHRRLPTSCHQASPRIDRVAPARIHRARVSWSCEPRSGAQLRGSGSGAAQGSRLVVRPHLGTLVTSEVGRPIRCRLVRFENRLLPAPVLLPRSVLYPQPGTRLRCQRALFGVGPLGVQRRQDRAGGRRLAPPEAHFRQSTFARYFGPRDRLPHGLQRHCRKW